MLKQFEIAVLGGGPGDMLLQLEQLNLVLRPL
jgi:hypothetical protein